MAIINSENVRSVALAKRIGMVQEGYVREARLVDRKLKYSQYTENYPQCTGHLFDTIKCLLFYSSCTT